jgi:hypothetical protein
MKLLIDRIEGDFAVCQKEDRTMLNINRRDLPVDAKEGDLLSIDGDNIMIDIAATAKRKEMIRLLSLYKQNETT